MATWRYPQLRTPRTLDSQKTESRQYTNNMPLAPAIAASVAAAETLAHGAIPIELSAALLNRFACCSK